MMKFIGLASQSLPVDDFAARIRFAAGSTVGCHDRIVTYRNTQSIDAASLSRRWLVENGFGWLKQSGPLRQAKLRGLPKADWLFVFN